MGKLRYGTFTLLLAFSLSVAAAESRDRAIREPRFLTKVVRVLKFVVQPLGDWIIPPHP
jgi:hypothetical protein